ncbi:clavesin-2-like [Wyeomyia smithii]|uniref:clavesin-2-like n=1 Tax=Wyeomyia smithii TaxID=174621 RepID=UPI0024681080|nr:clavesin-2-like [Wyeomyia smithii]
MESSDILSVDKSPDSYDEYKFPLDEHYRKMAQEGLGETDEICQQSLTQMREWIAKHPFIGKCRTDSLFLLRFLRMRKFSVPKAQETLERYLAMRQAFPHWFQKLDPLDADMQELLEDNQFQILGQDSKRRTVSLIKLKSFNVEKFTSAHQSRHMQLLLETLFDDERTQIGGYVVMAL